MGGNDGDLSSEEGAIAVTGAISNATREFNRHFKGISVSGSEIYDGKELPW